jgi:hypothetical protein
VKKELEASAILKLRNAYRMNDIDREVVLAYVTLLKCLVFFILAFPSLCASLSPVKEEQIDEGFRPLRLEAGLINEPIPKVVEALVRINKFGLDCTTSFFFFCC